MPDFIQPLGFIFLRVSGAVLLFWLCYRLFFYEKVVKGDLFKLALCGLFGVAINQMLFFEGLNLTTPINAAVIMVTNPILVLIMGAFLATEAITKRKMLGITLGATGAISLITYGGAVELNPIISGATSWCLSMRHLMGCTSFWSNPSCRNTNPLRLSPGFFCLASSMSSLLAGTSFKLLNGPACLQTSFGKPLL